MNTQHHLDRRARRGTSRAPAGFLGVAIFGLGLAGSVGLQFAGSDPEAGVAVVAAQASAPCASAASTMPLPAI